MVSEPLTPVKGFCITAESEERDVWTTCFSVLSQVVVPRRPPPRGDVFRGLCSLWLDSWCHSGVLHAAPEGKTGHLRCFFFKLSDRFLILRGASQQIDKTKIQTGPSSIPPSHPLCSSSSLLWLNPSTNQQRIITLICSSTRLYGAL